MPPPSQDWDWPGTYIRILNSVAQSLSPSLKSCECVFHLHDLAGSANYTKLCSISSQPRLTTFTPCAFTTNTPMREAYRSPRWVYMTGYQALPGETQKAGKINFSLTLPWANSCLSYSGPKRYSPTDLVSFHYSTPLYLLPLNHHKIHIN